MADSELYKKGEAIRRKLRGEEDFARNQGQYAKDARHDLSSPPSPKVRRSRAGPGRSTRPRRGRPSRPPRWPSPHHHAGTPATFSRGLSTLTSRVSTALPDTS